METLTRSEALDTIDEAEQMGALSYLAEFWIGHSDHDPDTLADMLRDYVDECCTDGDRIRSYGPADSDETCLAEWPGVE